MTSGLGFDVRLTSSSIERNQIKFNNEALVRPYGPDGSQVSDEFEPAENLLRSTHGSYSTLRSISAMKGLLLAEVGDSMVELNVCGGGSGFREGQRIALEAVTPGGGTKYETQAPPHPSSGSARLSRHGTLLSVGATPGRNAAELKSILGSSSSRLKPGAALLPVPGQPAHFDETTSLEQAKPRARVEVDIVLSSNTCVQGGFLQGHIKVRIRRRTKKESFILISGGKVRVVGFECISNERDRYPFYQCSAPLSAVTSASGCLYESQLDAEGFAPASEGVHTLHFDMNLPLTTEYGLPKGILSTQSGVAVRYIAMVSIKVKDSDSGKHSIAHFYRNCEIWPRLNPSVILAPAPQPLEMTASKGLFMGGSGKVTMTASLHRLNWIAGQQCYVNVGAANATKKTIKSLTLTLVRSTIIFKPDIRLDALNDDDNPDPDACQTSTTQKNVAESTLEMGQHGARGHASAKGWWTGVGPGEHLSFSHFILLPPDALSITRSRLLEVEYAIRVTLSAGTLRTTDVQVTLPIRIVNFLSVDPPPSFPLASREGDLYPSQGSDFGHSDMTETYVAARSKNHHHSRPIVAGLFGFYGANSRTLESLAEVDNESPISPAREYEDLASDNIDMDTEFYDEHSVDADEGPDARELGNLSIYEDDTDEVVQHAIASARIDTEYAENAPRFADLYYASAQDGLYERASESSVAQELEEQEYEYEEPSNRTVSGNMQQMNVPLPASQGYSDIRLNTQRPSTMSRLNRPRGPSSFAARVQEKLEAAATVNETTDFESTVETCSSLRTSTERDSYFCARDVSENQGPDWNVQQGHEIDASRAQTQEPVASAFKAPSSDLGSGFITSSTSTSGSRLLPRPPSMATLPMKPAPEAATPPSPVAVPHACAHIPLVSKSVGAGPGQPSARMPTGLITDGGDIAESDDTGLALASRPPLVAPAGGSASSVKDKIRELEQRVKALA